MGKRLRKKSNKLTARQEEFLKYIKEFSLENGYPPSMREIARAFGHTSSAGAKTMLERLAEKGVLQKDNRRARGIKLPEGVLFADKARGIPVLGRIRAGLPVEAEENIEGYIPLNDYLSASSGGFFLIVEGESMKDKGILHGDYAFIQPQREISNGQIGAFRLNGEVTLKTFRKTGGKISLIPANGEFEPIKVNEEDNFEVIGRFVMLLRMVEKRYDPRLM
ncbi:MAG: transcriptional repressor LexA [Deferribacteraceae bacterium]|jgi:repressor LexA|nr:transcriptional repressor LexA [Deferribacteraceae bacterium]